MEREPTHFVNSSVVCIKIGAQTRGQMILLVKKLKTNADIGTSSV